MMTLGIMPAWLDPEQIISGLGPYALTGVALILFAECGILLGFFLPGDTLLFTTGALIAADVFTEPLWLVCLILSVAACLGNLAGYLIGYRAGPAIFERSDSGLIRPEHIEKTHRFFEKYGVWAIALARFVPVVRTFITVVAGVGRMNVKLYIASTTLGGFVWASGVTVMGYFLGRITFIRENIDLLLVGAVVLTVVGVGVELVRNWWKARRARAKRADSAAAGSNAAGSNAAGAHRSNQGAGSNQDGSDRTGV